MKKLTSLAVLGAATLALAACNGSDDASADASAESVEMPAEDALDSVADEPVEDSAVAEYDPAENAVDEQTATEAADRAEVVAAEAAAAAEAADAIDVE